MAEYTTAANIKLATGVYYGEFEETTNASELDAVLDSWIEEIEDVIDEYCSRTWIGGTVPKGITRAATMMTSQVVALARQRRSQAVIKVGDFEVKLVEPEILTDEVKEILDLFRVGGRAEIDDTGVENYGNLGVSVLTTGDVGDWKDEDKDRGQR